MFKINKLILIGPENKTFDYIFESGINYFKGVNSSGKTEFYSFIDYMFGSSDRIDKKDWFKNSLNSAIMEFEYNNISYEIKRTLDKEVNYFKYKDEHWAESIDSSEFKDRLNSVFAIDSTLLRNLRDFTEEDLTYRTFTVFNFLGEKGLGVLNDFFDKGRDIKYSIKLPSILNYVFNNNLERIAYLKKELAELQNDVGKVEKAINRFEFVKSNINLNLKKLNIPVVYIGKNKKSILNEIESIKSLEDSKKNKQSKTISELQSIYNNLEEQIKIYENTIEDNNSFRQENMNRQKLLDTLLQLVSTKKEFDYLINPLINLIGELEKSISFNKYVIYSNTIGELKKQKEAIKKEMIANEARFTCYDISEKARSIALVEEYMEVDVEFDTEELETKQRRIRELKAEIKILQNSDNDKKINDLSNYITTLYKSAKDFSDFINSDNNREGFYIQYYKKGNLLQPKIHSVAIQNKSGHENYYTGSMARHTLIQLCGYLGFLDLLIKENKYPLIPILVIDHISKPFDSDNRKAIGAILYQFFNNISMNNLQIFMFDDEDYVDLSITPNHYENLVTDGKSGFNPFYTEQKH